MIPSLPHPLVLWALPAWSDTLRVPDEYPSVAAAAEVAQAGDVIEVAAGTFLGTAVVTVDLSIVGAGSGQTVLQGGTHTALRATDATVSLTGVTIESRLSAGPAVDLVRADTALSDVVFLGQNAFTYYPALRAEGSDLDLDTVSFDQVALALQMTGGDLDSTDSTFAFQGSNGLNVTAGDASISGGSIRSSSPYGASPDARFSNGTATLSEVALDSVVLFTISASLTIEDSTFVGRDLRMEGNIVVRRSIFDGVNPTVSGLFGIGSITVEDCVITNSQFPRGLASIFPGGQLTARRNTISNSTFDLPIFTYLDLVTLEDNTFADNTGSLLTVGVGSETRLVGNTFVRNTADGPLLSTDDEGSPTILQVEGNVFQDNSVSSVLAWEKGPIQITRNLFVGNHLEGPPSSTGLLIGGSDSNVQVAIAQNTFATTGGSGPIVDPGRGAVAMRNNLFVGHRTPDPAVLGQPDLTYNLFWDNAGGDLASGALPATNLAADPLFDTWRTGPSTALDLTLLPGSPAIDAGDPAILDADGSRSDIGFTGGPSQDPLLLLDEDGDGTPARFDCNDADATIFPGQLEVCGDEVDSDCDNELDQGSVYVDDDNDGFGAGPRVVVDVCELPSATAAGGDCDDADPSVSPGATETCDGRDEDCDGEIDEGACGTPGTDTSTSTPGTSTPDTDDTGDAPKSEDEAGCGCATSGHGSLLGLLAGLLALGNRRRMQSATR